MYNADKCAQAIRKADIVNSFSLMKMMREAYGPDQCRATLADFISIKMGLIETRYLQDNICVPVQED